MDSPRVGIIIPAFNEEKSVFEVIEQLKIYGIVILVDDGSSDLTSKIVSKKGLIVIRHKKNEGYEEAINSGFKECESLNIEIILTFDADGQFENSKIPDFVDKITEGADVVCGNRNKLQRISEKIFSIYSSYKINIKDPLCGLKAYKMKVYKDVGFFDTKKLAGTELLFLAHKKGYILKEINLSTKEREGKSKYGDTFIGNIKIFSALFKTIIK